MDVASRKGGAKLDAVFRTIFDSEFTYVCRSLRRCGVRDADIEDLSHDVFLAAHCGFGEFDQARPIKPWLFGIAFRIASHHKRRAGYRYEEIVDELDSADPSPAADARLEAKERERMLLAALDSLDDDRRAVVVMHDLDEIPMKEIAAVIGIPLFTGYSRLRAGRADLVAAVRRIRSRLAQRDASLKVTET